MPRLEHRPALDGAFTHDGEDYRIEDGIIEVESIEVARDMADHPRITLLDVDATPTPDADESDETYYCGVNGCSREVDSPEETCWQHE